MNLREAFVAASRRLAAAPHPTESPDLDARVLLGHTLGLTHAQLLSRWPEELNPEAAVRFQTALDRRVAGEPMAWITGSKEFMGMDFDVPSGLLVPRADTETLVEAALELSAGPRVVDVCTGTGCVAVALAALSPAPLEVWAADLSPLAVETSRSNAVRLLPPGRQVRVLKSDLLTELPGPWNLIISNPPYLTPAETRERVGGGWKEPALALDGGGKDGLNLIRRLVAQTASALPPGGWLLIEAADAQMPTIGQLFEGSGLKGVRFWKDLAGQQRVAGAHRA